METNLSLVKRLKRSRIRIEAKLESGPGDRWIPPISSLILATSLIWMGLARIDSLRAGPEVAGYSQTIWLLGQGYLPESTLLSPGQHALTIHWSFILYPLAGLGQYFDPSTVLVVTQGVSMGLGCWFLWRLAREIANLRIGGALALVIAYSLHPATHRLGAVGFHPEAIAVPALFAAAYFSYANRWVLYWAAFAVVLAARADYGLALALWGILLVSAGHRRQGLWTAGVGTGWTLGLLLVAEPLLSNGTGRTRAYGQYGDSLSEATLNMVLNPVDFVTALTSEANILLAISLLFPVMFLPLLSLRHFLPAVPLSAVLIVAAEDSAALFAEKASLVFAFIMIASVFALARFGNVGVTQVFVDIRVLAALVLAALLGFVSDAPDSPYNKPWQWTQQSEADDSVRAAVDLLDVDDAVRASPSSVELLAERRWLYEFDTSQQPRLSFAGSQVRAVLIDERDFPELSEDDRAQQRASFQAGMSQQGFLPIYSDEEFGVWLFYRQ